jgi:hypothetical protein
MADQVLVESKVDSSIRLSKELAEAGLPLLAAYWEWREERGGWIFFLVPTSSKDESLLIEELSARPRYRSTFSLGDVIVDSHQMERARAIAAYIRRPSDIGRQFDTTFTGGHYFERVVPVYFSPELMPHLRVA